MKSGILNLTPDVVKIRDVTFDPSGCVARVIWAPRQVGVHLIARPRMHPATNIPIIEKVAGYIELVDSQGNHAAWNNLPLIDEDTLLIVSREVAEMAAVVHSCDSKCPGYSRAPGRGDGEWDTFRCDKHLKSHRLASRMVWAAQPITHAHNACEFRMPPCPYDDDQIIGYRALQRVPR